MRRQSTWEKRGGGGHHNSQEGDSPLTQYNTVQKGTKGHEPRKRGVVGAKMGLEEKSKQVKVKEIKMLEQKP